MSSMQSSAQVLNSHFGPTISKRTAGPAVAGLVDNEHLENTQLTFGTASFDLAAKPAEKNRHATFFGFILGQSFCREPFTADRSGLIQQPQTITGPSVLRK